jgi:small-conductance mechanosensitive channel
MLKNVLLLIALLLSLASSPTVYSADSPQPAAGRDDIVQTAPVRIDGAALFPVRGISAHPAEDRADAIATRIIALAEDPAVKADSVVAVESDHSTDIMAGDRFIMSVFDVDAELDRVPRQVLAKAYAAKIRMTIESYRRDRGSRSIVRGAAVAAGASLALIALILLIRWGFRKLIVLVENRFTTRIRELQAKSHDIVRTEWIWTVLRSALRTTRIILVLILVFFYLGFVLTLFPWTRAYAVPLVVMVLGPLRDMGIAVLDYLPKFIFLIILSFVARYALNLLRVFFLGVQRGKITFAGFEPDWALPIYKLARLAVIAFTVVVAYPYIPGSESPAFKGVSLFLGIVFSLGSSSSISNIVSGYMVTFRRAYKVGDRVKVGNQTGDVTEIRLQATHLRTIKNEEVIVPNSLIINTEVVNYSSLARKGGLILHTTVTIGYDTPWRQIHAMLLKAAEGTPGLLKEPRPFVLQTGLNDFYVSYELNACTDRPGEMASIYSDLHQNIQDAFNEHGVQIMSPHYLGDPALAKIVPKEHWYQPPAKRDDEDGPAKEPPVAEKPGRI